MIEIDGSYLESGGQILRTSITFSVILKEPCRVFNIRKKRDNPGLQTQHLNALLALANLCNAKVEGAELLSQEVKFFPGEISKNYIDIKIETAGSITLILQTLILPSIFSKEVVEISIVGGATDTFFAPTMDYFQFVFLKFLEKVGVKTEINVIKRGYFPEGEAKVIAKIFPSKLKNIQILEPGNLKKIIILSGASNKLKEKKVAERQITGAKSILGKLNLPLEEKINYYDTLCPGSNFCEIAEFENSILGVDNLGKIGKSAEEIGKETSLNLLEEAKNNPPLDSHLADQIIPYLALAKGKSSFKTSKITNHLKTNAFLIEKFTKRKIIIDENNKVIEII
ncbi:MAG: RNA 3'-terminal phosphate cyclase [Minisyncoccia bacterium]